MPTSPRWPYSRSVFFFYSSGHHRALHSFPTRRSSDLRAHTPEDLLLIDDIARRAALAVRNAQAVGLPARHVDRKSTRLNSSHPSISYAVFCLKKKKTHEAGSERA